MSAISDKRGFKVLMWVCMFMYMLALSPHHHHGEADAPCFNVAHCIGDETGGDHGADMACGTADDHQHGEHDGPAGHKHDNGDENCSINDTDLVRADREDARPSLLSANDILLYEVFLVGAEEDPCGHCRLDDISQLDLRRNTGAQPAHIAYIAAAIPPRAPSFTA